MTARPADDLRLALRHAPVLLQKAHPGFARADFLTRVDFAGPWNGIHDNWNAVWAPAAASRRGKGASRRFRHALVPHAYASRVETHTHRFLLYAFYHPQDWLPVWGDPSRTSPNRLDQHVHDMEGALAVVPKRSDPRTERVEALLTVSHFRFLAYAGPEDGDDRPLPGPYRVTGWTRGLDGPIRTTDRFAAERGEPPRRFKLYAASGGHAIQAVRRDWGSEDHIVRYRPSIDDAEEPDPARFAWEGDAYFQTVRYGLLSMFEPGGLWDQRENPDVMLADDDGRAAFTVRRGKQRLPGVANPPWGWEDAEDGVPPGAFAWDPASLVEDRFTGLGPFSRQYVHNPYLGILDATSA